MLGERIREMRKRRKMTQQDLANRLRLAKSTISQYETGTNEPDAQTLAKIAEILGCTTDYLLGITDEPRPELSGETNNIPSEKAEFFRWAEDNLEDVFFYEFNKSPDEQKAEFLETVRIVWELHKRRMERQQKKGDEQGDV